MIEINPIKKLKAEVLILGSKYIANRLLIICALAEGISILKNFPKNEDTDNAIKALKNFGIEIKHKENKLIIKGTGGKITSAKKDINVGDSGTLFRFITSFAALANGKTKITGSNRIKERPISELLNSLAKLGIKVKSNHGFAPILIEGGTFKGGVTKINSKTSSQFISSLLLAAPFAEKDVEMVVEGDLVSKAYVDLTIDLMKKFGVSAERRGYKKFRVRSGQKYKSREFKIPADFTSANYFLAAAAIVPGIVRIKGLDIKSKQPESRFVEVLKRMGCLVKRKNGVIKLKGPPKLKAINIDMSSMPDSVQTLAVIAAFADGNTRIRSISHLKHKESDRIQDTANELRKLNVNVKIEQNQFVIKKSNLIPSVIDPHNDHRMAMSFALFGLKISGIKIKNPECVNKSFPQFWETLKKIGAGIKNV